MINTSDLMNYIDLLSYLINHSFVLGPNLFFILFSRWDLLMTNSAAHDAIKVQLLHY